MQRRMTLAISSPLLLLEDYNWKNNHLFPVPNALDHVVRKYGEYIKKAASNHIQRQFVPLSWK